MFDENKLYRVQSSDVLARVDEHDEDNLSPKKKRKKRYQLSTKFGFSDKLDDKISGKKWLNEIYTVSPYKKINNNYSDSGCYFQKPIEEVLSFYNRNFQEAIQDTKLQKYKRHLQKSKKNNLEFCALSNKRKNSFGLPNITIDEVELNTPKKVNKRDEMIIECEEQEEQKPIIESQKIQNDIQNLKVRNLIFDNMMEKYKHSDEVYDETLEEVLSHKREIEEELEPDDVIEENQEEYIDDSNEANQF